MDDKAILIDTIKKWIKLDNEYKQLSSELSKRRKLKKELNSTLIDIMKKNDIDNIDTKDGTSIIYSSKIFKKSITKKLLSDILAKFYNNDLDKASQLNDFILDNRESEIKETITRK